MHILHVIDSLALGGAERMLVDIANATARSRTDARVSVCVTRAGGALQDELSSEVAVWNLERTRRFDLAALRGLGRRIRDERIDVLHAHSRSTFSLLALAKTAGFVRTPIVMHDHYGKIEIDRAVPKWFPLARRHLARYVGVSPGLGEWAQSAGVPINKIDVIENALDFERLDRAAPAALRRELGADDSTPIGVLICGVRPEKGVDVMIEAASRLHAGGRDFSIAVVGGERDADYARLCRERVASHGLEARVRFLGERRDGLSLLRGADFAVLSSRSESGPLVLIEAMALGAPFVASRAGSIAARAASAGAGEFVPPGDAEALATAWARLLDLAPDARLERGQQGRVIAQESFDLRVVLPRWFKVYEAAMRAT